MDTAGARDVFPGIFRPLDCRRRRTHTAMHPPIMEVLSISRRALMPGAGAAAHRLSEADLTRERRQRRHRRASHRRPFPTKPRVEAKQDAAADAALAQAIETAARATDKKQAAEALLAVRKTYPGTTAGQEALYRAGVLFFEVGGLRQRAQGLQRAALREPALPAGGGRQATSWRCPRWRWAPTAMRTRRSSSLAERAEGAEREQAPRGGRRAAEGAGLYGAALDIAVKLAGDAQTPEEQAAAVAAGGAAGGGPRGLRGRGPRGARSCPRGTRPGPC